MVDCSEASHTKGKATIWPPCLRYPLLFSIFFPCWSTPKVTSFSNGVQEWCGKTAQGGHFFFPIQPTISTFTRANNFQHNHHPRLVRARKSAGFEPRYEVGTSVDVLDLNRVEDALATLHQEEDIADAMAGRAPQKRSKTWISGKRKSIDGSRPGSATTIVYGPDVTNTTPGSTPGYKSIAIQAASKIEKENLGISGAMGVKKEGKKQKARNVLAAYKHRGAQLVLAQIRKQHPFRVEGVFCRPDKGEWAGQVTISSNFWSTEDLVESVWCYRGRCRGCQA